MTEKKTPPAELALAATGDGKVVVGGDDKGELKSLGGSDSDSWNNILANQAYSSVWRADPSSGKANEWFAIQAKATAAALLGIAPQNEIEGMMAAQLIAAHNAAMECHRRAMLREQSVDGRRDNLNQANKLSRTFVTLLEALNRSRGKGQQKVTVEHVHVHSGGQAVVGMVETAGGGGRSKSGGQPDAIAYAPQPAMRSPHPEREAVPVTGNAEWPLPDARGKVAGGSEG